MELKDFLESRTAEERDNFIKTLNRHPFYIASLARGQLMESGRPRRPSVKLALDIEAASCGLVQRWELLPDVYERPAGLPPPAQTAAPAKKVKAEKVKAPAKVKVSKTPTRKTPAQKTKSNGTAHSRKKTAAANRKTRQH